MYLDCIEFEIGERCVSIEDLIDCINDQYLLDRFKKFGITKFYSSDNNIYKLGEKCIKKTLEGVKKHSIDKFVFTTSSFHKNFKRTESLSHINDIMNNVEINAYPYGVFLSECLNFYSALKMSIALNSSESEEQILLLTTDVIDIDESRVIPPGLAIKSDGAASCIISNQKRVGSLEIVDVYQKHNKYMLRKDDSLTTEEMSKEFSWCLEMLKKEFIDKYSFDYCHLVTHNYNNMYPRTIAYLLGLEIEKFFISNIPLYAHCFSSDILINLRTLIKDKIVKCGDIILTVGTSPSSVGAAIFKVV